MRLCRRCGVALYRLLSALFEQAQLYSHLHDISSRSSSDSASLPHIVFISLVLGDFQFSPDLPLRKPLRRSETPADCTACLKFFHHVIVEVLVDDGIVCAEGGVGIMGIGLN